MRASIPLPPRCKRGVIPITPIPQDVLQFHVFFKNLHFTLQEWYAKKTDKQDSSRGPMVRRCFAEAEIPGSSPGGNDNVFFFK